MFMPDIQPYMSMVDGSMIASRSHHREHLKRHGVIEVGNETAHLRPKADLRNTGSKQAVIESIHRAKAQYGSRAVERSITDALHKAREVALHKR